MTTSQRDLDELMTLRSQAAELRAERERSNSASTEAPTPPPIEASADEQEVPELDETMRDLTEQVQNIVKDLEEAAKERPALALLAALTVGIIIGQLVHRR